MVGVNNLFQTETNTKGNMLKDCLMVKENIIGLMELLMKAIFFKDIVKEREFYYLKADLILQEIF